MYLKLAVQFQDFEKKGPIFKKFVDLLVTLKEKYQTDPAFVKWLKLSLNHAYGKLSMKPYDEKSTFCNSLEDLERIIMSDDVLGIVPVSSKVIDVISASKSSNDRRPTTCIPLGVHIYAYARQLLETKIQEAKQKFSSAKVYMVNTDSCMLSIPQKESISILPFSTKIGDWKDQIKDSQEILKFFSLNAVTYHVSYLSNKNEFHQMTKMAGFRLNTILATSIDSKEFEDLIQTAVMQEKKNRSPKPSKQHKYDGEMEITTTVDTVDKKGIKIAQIRKRNHPGLAPTETVVQFCLKSSLNGKRVVLDNFQSLPYGFKDVKNKL